MIVSVAWRPSTCGMLISMVITSGSSDSASEMPSRPSRPCPTTSSSGSELMMSLSTLHMNGESSTTRTRIFFPGAFSISIVPREHGGGETPLGYFRPNQIFDGRDQLIFLHRLGEKCERSFLHGAIAVPRASSRSDDHHRNSASDGILPQVGHKFVAVHARHFK